MSQMDRLGTFRLEAVFPFVAPRCKPRFEKEYLGHPVYMDSWRYHTFLHSGTACVSCGLEGHYFALEKQSNNHKVHRYHFNLYGLNAEGEEILFTKDHIIPRSRGGKDRIENFQTMCYPCNQAKGTRLQAHGPKIVGS